MKKFFPTEHLENYYSLKTTFLFFTLLLFSNHLFSQNATNGGTISMDQEICIGESPNLLEGTISASGGGNTDIEYLWMTTQQANQSISNWSTASGINNQEDYQPPTPGTTTYYVRCARRQGFSEFIAESNVVTITVLNSPTAIINGNPDIAFVGSTINFSAGTAFNGTYSWDFNDDGIIDCTGQNCSNTYTITGSFTVTLFVDNGDCTIEISEPIFIQSPFVNGIINPCTCDDPLNFFNSDNYFVHDYFLINSGAGEIWELSDITMGNLFDNSGNALPLDINIPEGNDGVYYLDVWFISGEGYSANVTNGTSTLVSETTDPCNCINPLPIELANFEGVVNGKTVTLKWVTASETNNSHFEVERSLDGSRFDHVGSLEGQGHSTTNHYYSLVDENSIEGVTYYRLKQIDFDGTYTYSNIISIEIDADHTIISVVPNPVDKKALVRLGVDLPNGSELEIYSAMGKLLQTYVITGTAQEIDIQNLAKGIYFLRVKRDYKNLGKFFKIIKI